MYRPVSGFDNRLCIFAGTFSYDPMTFAIDPRVVESVTESVPVETLHKVSTLLYAGDMVLIG